MKDLERMRKDAEKQIALAELENKLNECLEHVNLDILGDSFGHKGYYHVVCRSAEGFFKSISLVGVGEVLSKFPPTCKCRVYVGSNNYKEMDYKMSVHRGVSDSQTILEIEWTHDNLDIRVSLPIGEELSGFFVKAYRELTESEMSIYGIKKTRWNYNYRNRFEFLVFGSGEMVRFCGGYIASKSDSLVSSIVEHIKYLYDFSE